MHSEKSLSENELSYMSHLESSVPEPSACARGHGSGVGAVAVP